jgi:hypothetical protein
MRTSRFVLAVLAVLAGLAFVAVAPPRAEAQQGLQLGFRGGVSVASASLDMEETFSKGNRTGFVGGAFLDYSGGIFGFQVGGQYTQKGVDLKLENVVDEFSLSYLEIPAVIKLGIPLGAIKPSIFGGAGLGFITGCDSGGENCENDFESTDVSGIVGADLAIYLGAISLWADGRYHVGLSNISKASDVIGDLKNRNWTLQAGIGFRLGG